MLTGLAAIDFAGLVGIRITDDMRTSSLMVNQSDDLTTTDVTLALIGMTGQWDQLDLASIQGTTRVTNLEELGMFSRNVSLGSANEFSGRRTRSRYRGSRCG